MKTLYQKLSTFWRIMYFLIVSSIAGYGFSWVADWANTKNTALNFLALFLGIALIYFYVKFFFFCVEEAMHRAWDRALNSNTEDIDQ